MEKVNADYSAMSDYIRWLVVGLMVVVAASLNVVWPSGALLYRVASIVALIAASLAVAGTTAKGRAAFTFFKSARTELRKVVWPSRQEITQTTMVVIGVVIVMSLFLWLVDSVLFRIMTVFTG